MVYRAVKKSKVSKMLNKPISQAGVLSNVQNYFNNSLAFWDSQKYFDSVLLIIASILFVCGVLLYLIDGLHTAFFPLHNLGQQIFPNVIWAHITFVGDTVVALTFALILCVRFPRLTIAILFSALIGTLIIHGLKNFFATPRPPGVFEEGAINIIGPAFKRNSLPSGHTATAFILAGLVVRCASNVYSKIAILFIACLIGWSRVVCGVHWPVDVLIGASLGLLSAWIGLFISDKIRLNIWWYFSISMILLLAAIMLFGFDGGFVSTILLARVLSFVAIAYWVVFWGKRLYEFRQ